jgi:hypothetical protein
MSLQSLYRSSENAAVLAAFVLFIGLHAGLLFLFNAV